MRIIVAGAIEALSIVMTCAMVYLVPMSYSVIVICTYPMMHIICGYLMVNQVIRRYEIVAIFAAVIGFMSLINLDIAEIKKIFS